MNIGNGSAVFPGFICQDCAGPMEQDEVFVFHKDKHRHRPGAQNADLKQNRGECPTFSIFRLANHPRPA